MMARKHEIDMTTGSIPKKVLQYAIPILLTTIIQVFFHSADTFVVGRFASSFSMAAVGSTGSLVLTIISLFTGMGTGVSVMVARCFGSRDYDALHKYVHTSVCLGLIMGLFVSVLGFVVSTPLLQVMNTDPEVLPLASLYLKIYFLGTPFTMLYNLAAPIIRANGDTRRPMYYMIFASLVNIALNLLFVIVFHMDVAGVAIATVISNIIPAVLITRCLMTTDGPHRLSLRHLRLHREALFEIIRIGLPTGLNNTLVNFATVTIQSAVNSLGAATMAANTAAASLDGMIGNSMGAFFAASAPFVSQNFGAKKYDRIPKVMYTCLLYSTVIGLAMAAVICSFGRQLLGLYISADDPNRAAIISTGLLRLFMVGLPYFLCGIMDVLCGVLRGLGKSWTPFLVSFAGTCGLRILWIHTVFASNPNPVTLYLCYPLAWIVTQLVLLVFLVPQLRKLRKTSAAILSA